VCGGEEKVGSNIAQDRPFHLQLNINNVTNVVVILVLPLLSKNGVFLSPAHLILTAAVMIAWAVLVNANSERRIHL
jgi:hypothetical protein